MTSRHYNKAPIAEAVIDFRVKLRPGISAIDIACGLGPILRDAYPERQEVPSEQQMQLTAFGANLASQFALAPLLAGFRFVGADKRRIVTARVEGFSFSLLCDPGVDERHYDRWEVFRDEARALWDKYRAVTEPLEVTRVAVRYVNRFDLPPIPAELSDYFTTYPKAPESLPYHDMQTYGFQLVMLQPDIQATAVLNQQGPLQIPEQQKLSILLDIDLFSVAPLNLNASDGDTSLWKYMEVLHLRKNDIFEACITDKARDVIR